MGSLAKALARPGDPLVLPNGTVIQDPKIRKQRVAALVNHLEPKDYRPRKQTSSKELPAPIGVMNPVALVFMYTLLGLGDREIGEVLGIGSGQVVEIRSHPAYADAFNAILQEFISTESEYIQSRIAAYSHIALETVTDIVVNGEQETNRLKASQDILDRGGIKIGDGKNGKNVNTELRINIVDGDKEFGVEVKVN